MTGRTQAVLLRLFIGESDEHGGRPLHEAIVLAARAMGLAGATVLRGPMGFGRSSRLHTAKILRLSADLPLIIEIVDTAEQVDRFLARDRGRQPAIGQADAPAFGWCGNQAPGHDTSRDGGDTGADADG